VGPRQALVAFPVLGEKRNRTVRDTVTGLMLRFRRCHVGMIAETSVILSTNLVVVIQVLTLPQRTRLATSAAASIVPWALWKSNLTARNPD